MSALPTPLPAPGTPPAQFNWLTQSYESPPEQLSLPLPPPGDVILPDDGSVFLLATENSAQLLVSGFGLFLGRKSGRLVVRKSGKPCAEVPILRLQEVIIASRGVSFSSDLIEELCSRGIRLSCLSASGQPLALITSPLLSATVETRRAQLAAFSSPAGADIARWIVAGKLHNQEKLLLYFAKSRAGSPREKLRAVAAQIRAMRRQALAVPGDSASSVRAPLMGIEGASARLYWTRIADMLPQSNGFEFRRHVSPPDPVNAALNYAYGILYSHVWGAVMNAGLEPFAGFLHVDRSGKPSLVLDLVEEFRQPVVDRPLFSWLNKGGALSLHGGLLDAPSRENVASRVMARLQSAEPHRGKSHEIRSIIQMQARLAASAVRGLRPYRPFAFKW
ncbi:MAG: CRISPR-associated endonuclease Cas1 1 [Bryobacteraceae bacterium]|nr:CRISPR-associated endonuclease Cas1 1 [Bryobacteraceae bacterium]